MEVIAILFVGWLVLGALRRRPSPPTQVIHLTIIEHRDDRDPPRAPGPRHEPEIEAANRRAKEKAQ